MLRVNHSLICRRRLLTRESLYLSIAVDECTRRLNSHVKNVILMTSLDKVSPNTPAPQ